VLGSHVLSYLSDLTTLADRNALHLSTNERLLKVVRVDCDDGQRLVGLQVPKLVLDIWQSELQQGTMVVSRGLGVPAGSEPPQPMRPDLMKRYTTPPHLLKTPSFFGGSAAEATSQQLLSGSSHIAASSPHEVVPHQSTLSPQKTGLHSLINAHTTRVGNAPAAAAAAAAAIPTVTPKKQTSLQEFFCLKPTAAFGVKSAVAAAAASSNGSGGGGSGVKKENRVSDSARQPSLFSTPMAGRSAAAAAAVGFGSPATPAHMGTISPASIHAPNSVASSRSTA
jgi:hypothetical protein